MSTTQKVPWEITAICRTSFRISEADTYVNLRIQGKSRLMAKTKLIGAVSDKISSLNDYCIEAA